MTDFSGLDANIAIATWFGREGGTLNDFVFGKVADAVAVGVGPASLITPMEGLYTCRADLSADGLELLRDLSRFIGEKGFYGLGARAADISTVAERIIADGDAEVDGDPEIDASMIDAPAAPAPVPGPPTP